jgi:hypothetical protein
LLAEHNILFGEKGRKVSLPKNTERYKETKFEDLKSIILEYFSGNAQIAGFIDRIRVNYARYTPDQYSIIILARPIACLTFCARKPSSVKREPRRSV